jgi:prevent-host-death family protein
VRTLTATEVARNLSDVLDEAEHGETIVVTRNGRRVAVIGPAPVANGRALKELLRRHRPDDRWASDLREVRALLADSEHRWPED